MERLLVLLLAAAGLGLAWLAWQGGKARLRGSIRVDEETLSEHRPTLLYFSSLDCGPCRLQQTPIVAGLRQRLGERVRFEEYDAVEHPEVAQRYRVLTIPTTVVIAPGGKVVAINYGVARADRLERQLAQAGLAASGGPVPGWVGSQGGSL